jgi:CRISPR-associated protein Csb2
MIGLELRFPLGRYHANPWGEHVNAGAVEWPPSPWRILRALYSVSCTHLDLEDLRGAAHRALARLITCPPPSYTLPPSVAAHTRHFMPSRAWSPARPNATDLIFDGFRVLAPEDEVVVWWDTDLHEDERRALGALVARLGHLGRSEAVCAGQLLASTQRPAAVCARPADETGGNDDLVELLCPAEHATVDDLAVSTAELRRQRLSQPRAARRVTYSVQLPELPISRTPMTSAPRAELALFHVSGGSRPGIAEAVAVAQGLRAALQRRYDAERTGVSSPTLSGRRGDGPRTDQHRHAHYLALPDAGGRRVERLVVWAPEGLGHAEVRALASLSKLHLRNLDEPLLVVLASLGRASTMRLPELLGPARRWRSLTPFGLVRHPKLRHGEPSDFPEQQVRLELRRRNLPEPLSVLLVPGSWHRFRSARVGQSRLQRARVYGAELDFAEPVQGPIVIGALCHFGLGVFTPSPAS